MKSRVLIAPAPLQEIEYVYGPVLKGAHDLVFSHVSHQMNEQELLEILPGCAGSLAGSEPYTRAVIAAAAAKGLKVIARAGVGYDAVDLAAATEHGVAVCFAPGTNQDSVAEHTFSLILALSRNLVSQHNGVKAGQWPRLRVNQPIRGSTLGVMGLGRIGKAVALRGKAFLMNVVAYEPYPDAAFVKEHGITLLPFDEALKQSDWISLHMPMSPESSKCINARSIGLMKPTAYLINTARGGVINEPDLYEALKTGRLAGAGLDVFDEEPPPANHPLLMLDNVVFTAHTAGVDVKSRDDMAHLAARAIAKLLAGEWPADWVVNPKVKDKFFEKK